MYWTGRGLSSPISERSDATAWAEACGPSTCRAGSPGDTRSRRKAMSDAKNSTASIAPMRLIMNLAIRIEVVAHALTERDAEADEDEDPDARDDGDPPLARGEVGATLGDHR